VANVSDANDTKARGLIETILMNAAVRVAAGMTAEEITQTRTDAYAKEVKRLVNEELTRLNSGIEVSTVEIPLATVPLQTRQAFVKVTQAENIRTGEIRDARQKRSDLLNAAGGASYAKLLARLDELDAAKDRGDAEAVAKIEEQLDYILEHEAAGVAGAAIRAAKARYTEAVQALRGDVEEIEKLRDEYERAPQMLVDRLWQETERRILGSKGVTKWFMPAGDKEVRIQIGPDPRETRAAEEDKYRAAEGEIDMGDLGLDLGLPTTGEEAGGE
jgi:regulator of protease activity HflC (stomatin/prohibitin superfamily)